MMLKLLLAAFLVGHGLIHASYLTPIPPRTAGAPEWPFEMGRSWLVTEMGMGATPVRLVGSLLIAVIVVSFVLAALSTIGIGASSGWWMPLVVIGSVASAVQLALFFHPWLVLGLAIDAVLLWAAVSMRWTPFEAFGS